MNFFKRPSHTLLYLSTDKIIRLDSDRKGIIKGEVESFDIACETASSIPMVIEKFITQAQKPLGRKVWILYSRLNNYQLSLPSIQVKGVENDVLEQALQFEYEALTGETLTKSQLSHQFINESDDMSHYWISLIATETLNRLEDVLKDVHSSLAGLAHAGGLPNLLSPEETASWLKLEYWDNTIFALSKTPELGLNLYIFHPLQNQHWQDEVNNWLAETGVVDKSELLLKGQSVEMLSKMDSTYHLVEEETITLWMGLWLQQLIVHDGAGIPLLNQQTNVNKELIYMISGGVIALILCASHATWLMYKTNDYQFQFDALSKEKKNVDKLRKTLIKNQDKIKKLTADIAILGGSVDVIPDAMTALKQRPAMLLKTLAIHSPNDLVVEDIKHVEQNLVISGVSLQAQLSNQLASMIDDPLRKMGWQVSTPTKKSLDLFGKDQGPWAFELIIKDLGLKGFIKPSKS